MEVKCHTTTTTTTTTTKNSSKEAEIPRGASKEMFHAPIVPRVRKRSRPAEASVPRREEVKFGDVRLYLVERKMGRSRRSFLTQLARSKGFIVEDVLRLEKAFHFVVHWLSRALCLKAFSECEAQENTQMQSLEGCRKTFWVCVFFFLLRQPDWFDLVVGIQGLFCNSSEMEGHSTN